MNILSKYRTETLSHEDSGMFSAMLHRSFCYFVSGAHASSPRPPYPNASPNESFGMTATSSPAHFTSSPTEPFETTQLYPLAGSIFKKFDEDTYIEQRMLDSADDLKDRENEYKAETLGNPRGNPQL